MNAPKRRPTHLEIVEPTEAHVRSAFYLGRQYEQTTWPTLPRKQIIGLWVMQGVTTALMILACVLIAVRG